jgi:hypothetical protein
MLGMLFTIMDAPMTIQNSGVFILGIALTCLSIAFVMACCMIIVRDEIEVIAENEDYAEVYILSVQSRFDEIVNRVQQSLSNDGQITLGFASA